MKLSIVTLNEDFIKFLETRTTGMSLVNRYSSLADERELQKFRNDFNRVDSFIFLDFQDLSKEFKEFIDFLKNGKSYFLATNEVLVVTLKNEALSPTVDLNKTLEAVEAIMEGLNINLRIVRLEQLKFQDIYKSLTSSDSIAETKPQKLIKYKVMHTAEGVVIPPKKSKEMIVPENNKGEGARSKSDDLKTSVHYEQTIVKVPTIVEHVRVQKEFNDGSDFALVDTIAVFVTGIRYAGKSTLALMCAKELEEQGINSLIIDMTSRKDIALVNRDIKAKVTKVKGLDIEGKSSSPIIVMNVFRKVTTTTFLTELLKSAMQNRIVTFCEVDPEHIEDIYTSYRGSKVALMPIVNTMISIRDSLEVANKISIPIVPIANNIVSVADSINKQNLVDSINKSKFIFDIENVSELVSHIMK